MASTSDVVRFFTAQHDVYDRFIWSVGYPQGLRTFLEQSQLLRSGLRVLDAGCGTGALTIALLEAFERKGVVPGAVEAFDLTPAMLNHLHKNLERRGLPPIPTMQANVLQLDQLPPAWSDYDLIVSASMLEYLPRERLADALAGLRSKLADSGHLLLFITKRNWLTRPLVGWWWRSNLYDQAELIAAFKQAGFPHAEFRAFPPAASHLATWGRIIEAPKTAPVPISTDATLTAMVGRSWITCAFAVSRDLLCWGLGEHGRLGNGSGESRPIPTRVVSRRGEFRRES